MSKKPAINWSGARLRELSSETLAALAELESEGAIGIAVTDPMPMLATRVPGCLGVTPNEVRRWHWSKTRRVVAKCRLDVGRVLSQFDKPELPVVVTMTRCGRRRMDDDGVVGAMKSVRDEIARWLGVDDSDERVTWHVEQKTVPRPDVGTSIRIEASHEGGRKGGGT